MKARRFKVSTYKLGEEKQKETSTYTLLRREEAEAIFSKNEKSDNLCVMFEQQEDKSWREVKISSNLNTATKNKKKE